MCSCCFSFKTPSDYCREGEALLEKASYSYVDGLNYYNPKDTKTYIRALQILKKAADSGSHEACFLFASNVWYANNTSIENAFKKDAACGHPSTVNISIRTALALKYLHETEGDNKVQSKQLIGVIESLIKSNDPSVIRSELYQNPFMTNGNAHL
jgi:hypothetical protein